MLKKKKIRVVFIYILFTYNNIFYLILNFKGKLIFWTSSGSLKEKQIKKTNINSIKKNLYILFIFFKENNINVHLILKGTNKFKKLILKYIKQFNYNFLSIREEFTVIHNGCRKKKKKKI